MNRSSFAPFALAAALALSACTNAAVPATAPTAAAPAASAGTGEKVKVSWWTENLEDKYQKALQENFVKTFNDANPDIELELKFTDQLDEVLRTAVQAGAGPDIIQTPGPAFVAEYLAAGHIANLDGYNKVYNWDKQIFKWALEAGKLDGKLFSVPLTYETIVLWYNKKTLADNGWALPTNSAELEQIGEAAKAKKIALFVSGNAGWKGVNEWLVSAWYGNYAGADNVYKALTQQAKWDDPLFVEAIAQLNDYMQRGYFRGSKESYFATDFPEIGADLATGKGLFDVSGTWSFQTRPDEFKDNPADWDWAPLPSLRDGVPPSFPIGIGSTLSISSKSKNPDAAAKVLAWVYGDAKRAAKIIHDVPGEWVVPIELAATDFPSGTEPRFIRALETIASSSKSGNYGYTTWTFWPKKSDQFIIEQMDSVFSGKMTPAEFSQKLQAQYAQEAADKQLPPVPSR